MVHRPSDGEIRAMRRMSKKAFSTRDIAYFFDVSSPTVSYWLRVGRERCSRSCPPRRNAAQIDARRVIVRRLLLQKRKGHPTNPSAMAIKRVLQRKHGLTVSKQTILSDIRCLNFRSMVRPAVCCRGQDHSARLVFARKARSMNPNRVVFSDEKVFTTNDEGLRRQWVLPGHRPVPRLKMRWPDGRVMVWGAVGENYRHLVILPNKVGVENEHFRMTAFAYVRRCLSGIVPFLQTSGRIFQQDGAGCHTARSTLAYLEQKGVEVLQTPARSPDFNVIETLWAIMSRRVSEHAPTNRRELIDAIKQVWDSLTPDTVNALVRSFPKRCAAVVRKNGAM